MFKILGIHLTRDIYVNKVVEKWDIVEWNIDMIVLEKCIEDGKLPARKAANGIRRPQKHEYSCFLQR